MRPAVTADGGASRTRDLSDKSDKSRRAAGFGRLCRVFTAKRPDQRPPENGRRELFVGPPG
jgi:hypothetical protein